MIGKTKSGSRVGIDGSCPKILNSDTLCDAVGTRHFGLAGRRHIVFKTKHIRKINELAADSMPIAIYFEMALPLRGETPCKSVNGKISRDLDYPTL